MIGRTLLAGVTCLDEGGRVRRRVEFAGVVLAVDPMVEIEGPDDDPLTLPPGPEAYDPAGPGEYRLHSTGEVIINPDFVTSWTVAARQTSSTWLGAGSPMTLAPTGVTYALDDRGSVDMGLAPLIHPTVGPSWRAAPQSGQLEGR